VANYDLVQTILLDLDERPRCILGETYHVFYDRLHDGDRIPQNAPVSYTTVSFPKLGRDQDTIQDRNSILFFSVAFLVFMSVAAVPAFIEERHVRRHLVCETYSRSLYENEETPTIQSHPTLLRRVSFHFHLCL
jgi:hypothetical protein